MKKLLAISIVLTVMAFGLCSYAGENLEPVPEIDFLTWVAAKYNVHYETSNYIAEQWRKLGLKVNLNQSVFPSPMLSLWFTEHNFDAVLSDLSGLPYRMEPDFFTNSQFNSKHMAPGNWNVGEWANKEYDEVGEKQLEIYDPMQRRPLIYRLQEIYYDEQPETIVYHPIQTMSINTTRVDLEYVSAPDGLRSIWNMVNFTPKGGAKVLKVGIVVDQSTWNPVAAIQSNDFEFLRMVYDRLVQIGPKGEVRMWAAESVHTIDDTTIDVSLRKDLKFSDGKPLTAEDVKFTYEFMKEWEAAYFLKYLKPIARIDLVDQYKLRFHLDKPFAPFIMNTLGQVFIIPKHIWKDVVEKHGLTKPQDYPNMPLVGSGFFTLEYWKESQEFLLRTNKNHFMAPKVDLLYVVFGTRELLNAALKKGTIDINIQVLPPATVEEYSKDKNIKLFRVNSNGYISVRYQTARPIFKHKALRQAAAYAMPRKRIIEDVLGGFGGLTASSITPVNSFWHHPDLKVRDFNLDKARMILKDAGFRWDEKGRLCFPPK
jgi:peptide/nickel transport system substrate-binding protein